MNKGIAHVQVQQAQDRFRTHMQVAAQVRWFSAAPCLVPESSTSIGPGLVTAPQPSIA